MKTLSIRQPWAALIIAGLKDVENRTWATNYRGPLLIHVAQAIDREALRLHQPLIATLPDTLLRTGGIIGICELVDCVTHSHSRWFTGPYGFVLQHARPVRFVPQRGQLGLFASSIEEKPLSTQQYALFQNP